MNLAAILLGVSVALLGGLWLALRVILLAAVDHHPDDLE